MALFSDLKELKREWKEAGPLKKGLIILVLFLTTSSLTSLSDIIFKWKGVIADGLEFYRVYISGPIKSLFSFINIEITDPLADFFVVYCLSISGFARLVLTVKPEKERIRKPYSRTVKILGNIVIILICYSPALLLLYLIKWTNWNVIIIYAIPTGFLGFLTIGVISNNKRAKRSPIKPILELWGPVIVGTLLVLILAAVNQGLNRST